MRLSLAPGVISPLSPTFNISSLDWRTMTACALRAARLAVVSMCNRIRASCRSQVRKRVDSNSRPTFDARPANVCSHERRWLGEPWCCLRYSMNVAVVKWLSSSIWTMSASDLPMSAARPSDIEALPPTACNRGELCSRF